MGTLNLDAALIPGRGNVLIKDVSTGAFTPPTLEELVTYATDFTTPPAGWETVGHTSPDDLPTWDSDGGDSEVKRTWELLNAREIVQPETNWFVVKPLQLDNDVFSLYYGGGDFTKPNVFTVPANAVSTEKAALIVYIDAGTVVGEVLERTSVRKDSAMEMAVDDWTTVPLRFTSLSPTGGGSGHHWVGENFGSTAGA